MEQESKQAGVVEEQPKEEISAEVSKPTSTEEKATSERTYKEAEWRKMQSMKDQAEAKAQRYEKEVQTLRQQQEQQRLAARQKEIADLEGDDKAQADARRKHQLEDDLRRLEEENVQKSSAVERKYDQALELASQYNLSLAEARELMKAETPREMELMAQIKVAEKKTVSPTETQIETPTPDSGKSDAGTDSDAAFQEAWNEGKLPATKENIARAQKIINK